MSKENLQTFLSNVSEVIRKQDNYPICEAIGEYYEKILKNTDSYFKRYDQTKQRAVFYKYKTFHDFQNYLIEFESKFTSHGGKVIYVEDAASAVKEIEKILISKLHQKLILSQSKTLYEIGLYSYLKENKKEFLIGDLNKYFYPILPLSFDQKIKDISSLLKLDNFEKGSINVLNLYKKYLINEAYKNSISITGADALVADVGGVLLLENEGNLSINYAFSKIHIVVSGIDKLIPSVQDMELFNALHSTHSFGNYFCWNQTLLTGPIKEKEVDGPEEMYVILVDNGRTEILAHQKQRSILNCIECYACQAVCPVFKFINSDQNNFNKGPVDCIKEPLLQGFEKASHLAYACTLCGKCEEVCPMSISLPELILHNRKEAAEKGYYVCVDKSHMKTLKKMFLKRKTLESPYHRLMLKLDFKKDYGNQRVFPDFGQKSFHIIWTEGYGIYTEKD